MIFELIFSTVMNNICEIKRRNTSYGSYLPIAFRFFLGCSTPLGCIIEISLLNSSIINWMHTWSFYWMRLTFWILVCSHLSSSSHILLTKLPTITAYFNLRTCLGANAISRQCFLAARCSFYDRGLIFFLHTFLFLKISTQWLQLASFDDCEMLSYDVLKVMSPSS